MVKNDIPPSSNVNKTSTLLFTQYFDISFTWDSNSSSDILY